MERNLVLKIKGVLMAIAQRLVNKLKRRRKAANKNRGFGRQDKIDRKDEVLADSPGVFKYLRGIQRRQDRNFGQQMQPSAEYKPDKQLLAVVDLDLLDTPDRIEATFATAALVEAIGVQVGDVVKVLSGVLKGRELAVTAVAANVVTLEADLDLVSPETDVPVKVQISGTKTSFK
jgi:transcription antitermination factor NusG